MLSPAGRFGDFVLVLLALSVIGNIAMSTYSVSLNMQMLLPVFTRVPRPAFILTTLCVMVPVAVHAAQKWEESLINFLGLIGYWAGCFCAVSVVETVAFRRMDYTRYEHAAWNVARELPPGVAALGACLCSMALVVPGMAAPWYTGPIAKRTGDVGFEMAFAMTGVCYLGLRWIEVKVRGRL